MIPRVGELRRRLVIEAADDVADGAGGRVRTWVPLATVFGAVRPVRRREAAADGRLVGLVSHAITIRRRDGVTGGVRFVAGGVTYRVVAVEDADPGRRFLTCLCEEEQP